MKTVYEYGGVTVIVKPTRRAQKDDFVELIYFSIDRETHIADTQLFGLRSSMADNDAVRRRYVPQFVKYVQAQRAARANGGVHEKDSGTDR